MMLSSVVKALGSLCLVLVDGLPVSEDESPKIIGPHHVKVESTLGGHLFLHCEAFSNCETDVTLIYWLVNDSFPEDLPSSGRIIESQESTLEDDAILHRSLQLKNISSEDLRSSFTCVVINSAGTDKKQITLTRTNSDCKIGKNRKHRRQHKMEIL